MYYLYIDESGTDDDYLDGYFNVIKNRSKFFTLGGIIVGEYTRQILNKHFSSIVKRYCQGSVRPVNFRVGGGVLWGGREATYRFGGAYPPPAPATLAGPPGEAALAEAEQRLDRSLPTELRQLYQIGDGGFGPGEGLFPLAELVERYTECVREPIGPGGQRWPANLIPLFDQSPQLLCLDADTGRMICWDPEMIEDVEEGEDWDQSFVPEADSLAAVMEAWLASPTMTEQMDEARQQPFTVPQATIDFYAAMSPQERAEYGFEGEDWEEQLRRSFNQR